MKQLFNYGGYTTFDLTECKIHRIGDKFFACYPKKWVKGERQVMATVSGRDLHVCPHYVTEWEQVELDVKDKP